MKDYTGSFTQDYARTKRSCELLQELVDKKDLAPDTEDSARHLISLFENAYYIVLHVRDLGGGDVEHIPLTWDDGTIPLFDELEEAVDEAKSSRHPFKNVDEVMEKVQTVVISIPSAELNPIYKINK